MANTYALQGHPGTHTYKAEMQGQAVKVTDENGNEVRVDFGATLDMRTCTAHVSGVGFIGGWQCRPRPGKWSDLVPSINAGILYADMNDLPPPPRNRARKRRIPNYY